MTHWLDNPEVSDDDARAWFDRLEDGGEAEFAPLLEARFLDQPTTTALQVAELMATRFVLGSLSLEGDLPHGEHDSSIAVSQMQAPQFS